MIELRKIRERREGDVSIGNMYEGGFSPVISAPDISALLNNYRDFVDKIPENERYNVLFTVFQHDGSEKRSFTSQSCIPIDVDGMTVDENGAFSDEYILAVEAGLGLKREYFWVLGSGNGMQVVVDLEIPFFSPDLRKGKPAYNVLCDFIDLRLYEKKLAGKCDRNLWGQNKSLRMPGTYNRKVAKAEKLAFVVNKPEKKYLGTIYKLAQVEPLDEKEFTPTNDLKYLRPDKNAVLSGCDFLKWAKQNPHDVDEPSWYAVASVLAPLEGGKELFHEFSREHPSYSERETDIKINQAKLRSGPRSCDNIDSLWGGCSDCPNYAKVKSPIQLKSEGYIASESAGFCKISKGGKADYQHEDLVMYFEKEHAYSAQSESEAIYVWNKTHYSPWSSLDLKNYSSIHFNPPPPSHITVEWIERLKRKNVHKGSWFYDSTRGFANFSNGVLNLESKTLSEHSPKIGFLHVLPYNWRAGANCTQFLKYLGEFTSQNQELIDYLLEFIGFTLCDKDYQFPDIPVLMGSGANGKSTFLDIFSHIVGKSNAAFLNMDQLSKDHGLMELEGKLLNICDELPSTAKSDTELLKKITGGVEIQARKLYKNFQPIKITAKFIFACNHFPMTRDNSDGFFRRFKIIPCTAVFKKDTELPKVKILEMINDELPHIFNLCLEAYSRLVKRGYFETVTLIEEEMTHLREIVDPTEDWLRQNFMQKPEGNVSLKEIYLPYREYIQENFQSYQTSPLSSISLSRRILKMFPGSRKTRDMRGIVLTGIGNKIKSNF